MIHRRGGPVRVAVVSNEPIARHGVVNTLESALEVQVLESAWAYPGLAEKLHETEPDAIVADLDVTDTQGADLLTALKSACPESPIVVFADEDQRESILQAIALGASGYVLKTAEKEELCSAVEAALSGKRFGGLELTPKMMWELVGHVRAIQNHPRSVGLAKREREVLLMMIGGHTTGEIASKLFLSVKTIRTYRQRMMHKLGTHSMTQLVVYALSHGLVEMPGTNGDWSRSRNPDD